MGGVPPVAPPWPWPHGRHLPVPRLKLHSPLFHPPSPRGSWLHKVLNLPQAPRCGRRGRATITDRGLLGCRRPPNGLAHVAAGREAIPSGPSLHRDCCGAGCHEPNSLLLRLSSVSPPPSIQRHPPFPSGPPIIRPCATLLRWARMVWLYPKPWGEWYQISLQAMRRSELQGQPLLISGSGQYGNFSACPSWS